MATSSRAPTLNAAFARLAFHSGLLAALKMLLSLPACAEQVQWTGGDTGEWDVGYNWSTGSPPTRADDVLIGQSMQREASVRIRGASVSVKSIRASVPLILERSRLEVTSGTTSLLKGLECDGASISASGAETRVTIVGSPTLMDCQMKAESGASIAVRDAPHLNFLSTGSISAIGAGSTIDLSSVTHMDLHSSLLITAQTGGVLDLSQLQRLIKRSGKVDVEEKEQGIIRLNSLKDVQGEGSISFYLSTVPNPLPTLEKVRGLEVPSKKATTLFFPSLKKISEGVLSLTNGMTLNAPNLTEIVRSQVRLAGREAVLNSDNVTNIDHTSFFLSGGAVYDKVAARVYEAIHPEQAAPIISVEGRGSRLSLSSVKLLCSGHPTGVSRYTFRAADKGVLDLSGLSVIENRSHGGYTEFIEEQGGFISLPALREIIGLGEFRPSLFHANPFPRLEKAQGLSVSLEQGETISLPALTTLIDSSLFLRGDATLHASKLTRLVKSTIKLEGTANLDSGILQDIADTMFFLSSGARFERVGAESYRVETAHSSPTTVVSVSGRGSFLDLSSVKSLVTGHDVFGGSSVLIARDGGVLDLSSVEEVRHTGPVQSSMELVEEANGRIEVAPSLGSKVDIIEMPSRRKMIRGTGEDLLKEAEERPSPSNLEESLTLLRSELSYDLQSEIRRTPKHSLVRFHKGIGTWLRNRWKLRNPESPLATWFRARGVTDPDDMSSYILLAFWSKQRGEAFVLEDEKILWAKVAIRIGNQQKDYDLYGIVDSLD